MLRKKAIKCQCAKICNMSGSHNAKINQIARIHFVRDISASFITRRSNPKTWTGNPHPKGSKACAASPAAFRRRHHHQSDNIPHHAIARWCCINNSHPSTGQDTKCSVDCWFGTRTNRTCVFVFCMGCTAETKQPWNVLRIVSPQLLLKERANILYKNDHHHWTHTLYIYDTRT
jgi:hypothetical protein